MKTRIQNLLFGVAFLTSVFQATAQSTAFTYQGRVLDNGTNFTGTGQFQFALVTSINANHTATATANAPSGGYITGYTVTAGGSGYVTAPAVTVSGGGGSGALATAHISGGVVTSISVGNTGNGDYTSAPTVTIAPPPPNITYTTYWSNDGTSSAGSEPAAAVSVAVTNGLFTIVLGDTTTANMTAIDASLFMQPNLQLRIWFNDGANGFAALNPVQNLTPVPYADFANNANSATTALTATTAATSSAVAANAVNTVAIANNAVTASKIAGGQVVKSLTAGASTLYDSVTLAAGNNVTLTPNGQTVTIAAAGGPAVTSLNGLQGALTLSGDSDITVSTGSGTLTFNTTATSANTASTMVKRDANGNFNAGSITLANNLYLPSSGIIYSGGNPFIDAPGSFNFFGGIGAGKLTAVGSENVGIGASALSQSTGNADTAIGYQAMSGNNTGNANIALGVNAGSQLTTGNFNICIGNSGVAGDDGTIRIGDQHTYSAVIAGIYGNNIANAIPVVISPAGSLGTTASSAKFKQNIQSMGDTSDVLLNLRPVTFRYKPDIDPQGIAQFGLVAEEVEKVDPSLVVRDQQHGIYTVRYQAVDAMLLNEFIKEHHKVSEQAAEIQDLNARLQRLEEIVNGKSNNFQ